MPSIENYVADAHLRLLLQGAPGVGKTTLACQFPGVWVLDCDINLRGPLQWLREQKKALPLGYDIIDRLEDGTIVRPADRFERLVSCTNKAASVAGVQTLVFDSCTKIGDYIKDYVLKKNPTKSGGFEQSSWGFYYKEWVNLVATVTAAKVHCVFIFHEKVDKDEADGSMKTFINVQGQFRDVAGALFTDVWRCHVKLGALSGPNEWLVQTTPEYRYALKNSFGFPKEFKFDWKFVEEKLKAS